MSSNQFDPSLGECGAIFSLPDSPLLSTSASLSHLQQSHLQFPFSIPLRNSLISLQQQPEPSHNIIFPSAMSATPSHPIASALPSNYDPFSHSTFQDLIPSIPTPLHVQPHNPSVSNLFPRSDVHSLHGDISLLPPSLPPNTDHHAPMQHYPPLYDHITVPSSQPEIPAAAPPKTQPKHPQTRKVDLTGKNSIRKSRDSRWKKASRSTASVRCQLCPQLFENKVNAERHRRGNHPIIPHLFQCNHCSASYESKGARTIHVRKAHLQGYFNGQIMKSGSAVRRCAKIFKCRQRNCGRIYSVLSNLNRHYEMHHMKKRYPCATCDYSATTRWNLKVHESRKHEYN